MSVRCDGQQNAGRKEEEDVRWNWNRESEKEEVSGNSVM